jgi:hypothetical protein
LSKMTQLDAKRLVIYKNPAKDVCWWYLDVRWCRCKVVSGSLNLAARAMAQQAASFDFATARISKKVTVQWQMNRIRGARVLMLCMAAEHCDCFVSPVAFYHLFPSAVALLALKLSRKLSVHTVALCSPWKHHVPHCTAKALHARGKCAVALPHAFGLLAFVAGWTWCATSTTSAAAVSTTTTTMHSPTHRRLR